MDPLQYLVAWLLTLSLSNASAVSSLGSLPRTRSSFLSTKAVIFVRGGDLINESSPPPEPAPLDEPSVVNRSRPTPAVSTTTTSSVALAMSGLGAMATRVGRSYTQQLDQYPIFTKSYTAGVIFALSDYIAQRVEKASGGHDKTVDKTRLLASMLVGFLYYGPAAHYWYEAIFALLPGSSVWSSLQKAVLGQLIFGPSFTCIFFAASLLQAGKFSLGAWGQKIRSDLPRAWLAGAGFWPLVSFVSYSVVPVKWIPLFINLCSLVWTVYLSLIANRSTNTRKRINEAKS